MSKEIKITIEELEKEIKQAFIYGQGNKEMIEVGLERDETEDYVNSRIIKLKTKMSKLDKVNNIISEIEEFLSENGTNGGYANLYETDLLEFFASIISHLDTDIAIEVMEHFPKGKKIAQMMKDKIVLLNQNKDE